MLRRHLANGANPAKLWESDRLAPSREPIDLMAARKKKNRPPKKSAAAQQSPTTKSPEQGRAFRETVEAIATAFILAFLFRTFEAEAFVIPTGSMAPTLQGEHKDVDCPICDFRCRVGASGDKDVQSAVCGMCGYEMSLAPYNDQLQKGVGPSLGSYPGDRILVGKFNYEFGEPNRWDVVVFKHTGTQRSDGGWGMPGLPNYIKRLVGLPGERLRIFHGDIYTRPLEGDEPFRIERKPPNKVLALAQVVHDNRYLPKQLVDAGWPFRWQAVDHSSGGQGWQMTVAGDDQNVDQFFESDGSSAQESWIRYHHIVPSPDDWFDIESQDPPQPLDARPQLITDFYTYNASGAPRDSPYELAYKQGQHWVGDLLLECRAEVRSDTGTLSLDLVEAGVHFRCRIDLAEGGAALEIEGVDDFGPTAKTGVRGSGSYWLRFANVDDQLLLWVDGSLVEFDAPTDYDAERVFGSLEATRPQSSSRDPGDLAPAGIGVADAAVKVDRMSISRDIYYIASEIQQSPITDIHDPPRLANREMRKDFLSDPSQWDAFLRRGSIEFTLRRTKDPWHDQFFVLGDNSPFSQDGRLWRTENLNHFVERRMLIGKALFIYWPHLLYRPPFVNVPDMGLVR